MEKSQRFRAQELTLFLHQCGAAMLTLVVEWILDSNNSPGEEKEEEPEYDNAGDPQFSLRQLDEMLNELSDPAEVNWACTRPTLDLKGSEAPSKGKEKKRSSSSSSSSRNLRRREAHVLALGKVAKAQEEEEAKEESSTRVSLTDLADWLVAVPTEPPSTPPLRAERGASCFLHNLAVTPRLCNEDLKTTVSPQRTLLLSTERHVETFCMSLLREMVEDTLLSRDVLKRISWGSLHYAEMWEKSRHEFEKQLLMITPGSNTSAIEAHQQDFEETLTREVYRLSVLCAGVNLQTTEGIEYRMHGISLPFLQCRATEFRSELQSVLGVSSAFKAVKGHLKQQLESIKQATNLRHKKSYRQDRADADEKIRRLLLKESKRRRLEIILQSISAITLPMFLVTNYFTMNVPDLPQLSFWLVDPHVKMFF